MIVRSRLRSRSDL